MQHFSDHSAAGQSRLLSPQHRRLLEATQRGQRESAAGSSSLHTQRRQQPAHTTKERASQAATHDACTQEAKGQQPTNSLAAPSMWRLAACDPTPRTKPQPKFLTCSYKTLSRTRDQTQNAPRHPKLSLQMQRMHNTHHSGVCTCIWLTPQVTSQYRCVTVLYLVKTDAY